MSSFPLVVSPEIITLVLEKNEVLSVFSIIIICTNVYLFIILLSYKYIIFFSTPYLQCVISYCKCIQELFANNNNTASTMFWFPFNNLSLPWTWSNVLKFGCVKNHKRPVNCKLVPMQTV
jgi:hypothetical protein